MLVTWFLFSCAISSGFFHGHHDPLTLFLLGLTFFSMLIVILHDVLGHDRLFNNPHIGTLDKSDLEGRANDSKSGTEKFVKDCQ